jgi:ribosomal protein L27
MRMSGVTRFTEQWVYWYPDKQKFNMYYGPESHTENPDFPAPSGGCPSPDGPYAKAMSGWAPAQLSASVGRQGKRGGFVGGSARTVGSTKRTVSGARSAIAMRAHKMAASSTKNQGGGTTIPKFRGVQRLAFQGSFVKAGTLLVRQSGVKWATAGGGVKMCRNYNIIALKDGIVQWRGSPGTKNEGGKGEVTVVPWEYVRAKCEWATDASNESTLVYKEYKPWMGTHMHDRTATFNGAKNGLRRRVMAEKRKIWLESPEGQEHMKKKQEKREIQKIINAKWSAYRKAKREAKAKEAVDK